MDTVRCHGLRPPPAHSIVCRFAAPCWLSVAFLFALVASAFAQPGTVRWTTPIGLHCDSSPALADGTLYFGNWNHKLYAVDTNGFLKWTFAAGLEIKSSPAIADDGTIYFGCRDRKLYAVTPDGLLKWSFTTGAWVDSSPAIAADGTVYVGSWDNKFYALNANGVLKWAFAAGKPIVSSPAIGADGTIYFGSHDQKFYALNPDGTKRWEFTTGGAIISSPAIHFDGTIYFSSTDGKLYALHPDGSLRWRLQTGGVSESSPVLDLDGGVCIGVSTNMGAATPDGKRRWVNFFPTWRMVDSTPAIAADTLTYFASRDSVMSALLPSQERRWALNLHGAIGASPVIGPDGTVYLPNNNGKLHAIQGAAPLMRSAWPMFRANPRHTGRVNVERPPS